MNRILFISPPILNGSGGEVIRKRNRDFLNEYSGNGNLFHFPLNFYSYYEIEFGNEEDNKKVRNNRLMIENELRKVIEEFNPDIIYMDNSLMAVPEFVFEYKTMVFFHNIEKKYAEQDGNLDSKIVKMIELNEKKITEKANYLVCINERDSDELFRNYGRKADYILPISFTDQFVSDLKKETKGDYLLFVGSDFYGNTDGLFWFVENCLDKIESRLIVAGKGMEKYNGRFPDKKVTFLGFVQDLSILYANASCVVLPIVSGSGMKTKTCEAFMYGKKCFGTTESFEGYINVKDADAVICDSADEFVSEINNFLLSRENAYLEKARDYFMNNYESSIVKNNYFNFLNGEVNI